MASAPALAGSWVYDDRLMVGHPMLDGLEDVVPAFGRTSDDYQARTRSGPAIAGGSTYRPLAMVSFILVNGTVGPRPLAHHIVSLLCHLGAIWLLLRYAGPVGWVDADGNGEWGIALRCGQLSGRTARLFAGCGIVAGSEPAAELAETLVKLQPMRGALEG